MNVCEWQTVQLTMRQEIVIANMPRKHNKLGQYVGIRSFFRTKNVKKMPKEMKLGQRNKTEKKQDRKTPTEKTKQRRRTTLGRKRKIKLSDGIWWLARIGADQLYSKSKRVTNERKNQTIPILVLKSASSKISSSFSIYSIQINCGHKDR